MKSHSLSLSPLKSLLFASLGARAREVSLSFSPREELFGVKKPEQQLAGWGALEISTKAMQDLKNIK